jgi:phage shock protein A
MANIFSRMWNFLTGWLHYQQSQIEATQPEIVYDQALRDQRRKYEKMEEAVSGLVYNRNKLNDDIANNRQELDEVQRMLEQAIRDAQSDDRAVAENAMELGAALQLQEETLIQRLAQLTESRDSANQRIEEYQNKLIQFQARIKQLNEEKNNAVAQAAVDRETVRLNRELSGMAVDSESQSLNELRDKLGRLHAQAMMTEEMRGKSLEDRLQQYRLRARTESSQAKFLARVEQAKALKPPS